MERVGEREIGKVRESKRERRVRAGHIITMHEKLSCPCKYVALVVVNVTRP